jgi:uncharacterized protein YhfF
VLGTGLLYATYESIVSSTHMDEAALPVRKYWQAYLATLPAASPARLVSYDVDSFGDSPVPRASLGELIVAGVKTATCSALWEWEAEDRAPPRVGHHTVVLGAEERPLCIIRTTEVRIRPFAEVDAQFAAADGGGGQSLEIWRREHWRFFTHALAAIDRVPTERTVCERFRIVYR